MSPLDFWADQLALNLHVGNNNYIVPDSRDAPQFFLYVSVCMLLSTGKVLLSQVEVFAWGVIYN
jgi:hypothetical protein